MSQERIGNAIAVMYADELKNLDDLQAENWYSEVPATELDRYTEPRIAGIRENFFDFSRHVG